MNSEVLLGISGLWPIILIICLTIVVVSLKEDIGKLVSRLTKVHVKTKDTEVYLCEENLNKQNQNKQIIDTQNKDIENIALGEIATTSPVNIDTSIDTSNSESIIDIQKEFTENFYARNKIELKKSYERLQNNETNKSRRIHNEIIYYYCLFNLGDTSALDLLNKIVEEIEQESDLYAFLKSKTGLIYQELKDYKNAITEYNEAFNKFDDEINNAEVLAKMSTCLYEYNRKDESFNIILDNISKYRDKDAIFILYDNLSELYKKEGNSFLSALAITKALENKPNNTSLLFSNAYQFSAATGFSEVSLLLYKKLLNIKPDDASALNNIGVEYNTLGLNNLTIESYKKAIKYKNTLAASNLADIYINAGFFSEATEILNTAKLELDMHPNVAISLTSLDNKVKGEKNKEKECLLLAQRKYEFLLCYADAYFIKVKENILVNGEWNSNNGYVVNITPDNDNFNATWETNNIKCRWSGLLVNSAAKVEKYVFEYDINTSNYIFKKKSPVVYLYVSEDKNTIFAMENNSDKTEFITLYRQ